jgi:hypothetical protein
MHCFGFSIFDLTVIVSWCWETVQLIFSLLSTPTHYLCNSKDPSEALSIRIHGRPSLNLTQSVTTQSHAIMSLDAEGAVRTDERTNSLQPPMFHRFMDLPLDTRHMVHREYLLENNRTVFT